MAAGHLIKEVELQIVSQGYDRRSEWFQPRIGLIPPQTAVLTMTRAQLWGSDIFTAVNHRISHDLGRTWTPAEPQSALDRRPVAGGLEVCPCDMTPAWHAATGKLLLTGHTACYLSGERGALLADNSFARDTSYAVFDAETETWSAWQTLQMPDQQDHFFWSRAGCTQRVDLPGGDILLPLYCMGREQVGSDFGAACFFATVVRCAFDGTRLSYLAHGDELSLPVPRGFCEPSLTHWRDRYFLTLRNDQRGYVATSTDGLHYGSPAPWTFDDGQELGSYNTQQHWVTHSDALFLVYTRRGADNDCVIRHRAPLFLAEVDPQRLCVIRDTERVLVPNNGAQLGNFGTLNASPDETWVVTSEGMQGDRETPDRLELSEQRGADNRVYLCRIHWTAPNRVTT